MRRILTPSSLAVVCVLSSIALLSAQTARRSLSLDDLAKMKEVRDPQCAPDGKSAVFVVSTTDMKEDKSSSHIWTVDIDGSHERQITSSQDSESSPRYSPDGHYLSFTSSRPGQARGNQVWLLDRSGGEAFQLTEVKGRLQGYEWSPDSKRLALVVGDPDPETVDEPATGGAAPAGGNGSRENKVPKPIVIDRYKYKQDGQGYLLSGRHTFIYLFDITSKKLDRLTNGKVDEAGPSWSPDGSRIAFYEQPSSRSRSRAVESALRRRSEAGIRGKGVVARHQPRRTRPRGMES
jgi:Tol biopolymer transport system component